MSSRESSVASDASDASVEKVVEPQVNETIASQEVITKYRTCADICNRVLSKLVAVATKPGTKIVAICQVGDQLILKETGVVYTKAVGPNKVKILKGVAFPTCVSVNNIVGHFSPLANDEATLKEGDVVKIDLGVHIDGYCCVVAHTVVCGAKEKVKGRTADVIVAAYTAAELAARKLAIGNKNVDVTSVFQQVAKDFNVNMVQAVVSHDMSRNVIAGKKEIISRSDTEHKVDSVEFEVNQVWAIDVQMSTGEGKPVQLDERTTVFKRMPDVNYKLKMKASRFVASEIKAKFGVFPFTTRNMEDKRANLGIIECKSHGLVEAFPVLSEKPTEIVANFKFTALLLPNGILKITGLPLDLSQFEPTNELKDPALKALLEQPLRAKKKKAKKASTDMDVETPSA